MTSPLPKLQYTLKEFELKLEAVSQEKHNFELRLTEALAQNNELKESLKRYDNDIVELKGKYESLLKEKHEADIQATEAKSLLEAYKNTYEPKKRGRPANPE